MATTATTPFPWAEAGLTGGLSLLGSLFGPKGPDMSPETLNRLFGPGALSGDTMKLYQMLAQSPQFRQLMLQNSIQGGQFQNNLAQGLGQRGLSTSGIGTIANAAGNSAIQTGQTALQGGLFGEAGDMAMKDLMARLQAYSQGQGYQNQQNLSPYGGTPGQKFFGSMLGAVPYLFPTQQGQTQGGNQYSNPSGGFQNPSRLPPFGSQP
jgi:hypothetical protein